jgi:hypothetical protein
MARTRTLAARLLAIPIVVVIVLAGIWVTGALLTNDFAVAMWLTAAWMGLAGLLALGVAARSRALRLPVLGAYAATAAVAGFFLTTSAFLDREVNEQVAVAAEAPAALAAAPGDEPDPVTEPDPASGSAPAEPAARRENVRVRGGRFSAVRHPAMGRATVIELAEGGRVLTLTDFEVDNGPDLRLYLVAGTARTEAEVDDYVDLGGLKGNRGDQQYRIPRDVDVGRFSTVVVWCRAFSVLFARAPLRP